MSLYPLSIKQKIIWSCAIVSVIIAGMIVATFYLTGFLQTKIAILEEVTKLEEHVQELRRSEKNLFLYRDPSYGKKALFILEDVQRILNAKRKNFGAAASVKATDVFQDHLNDYVRYLSEYLDLFSAGREGEGREIGADLEEKIRNSGSHLSGYAETRSKRERSDIEQTMTGVRSIEFGQLVVFGAVMVGFWVLVIRKVILPLRALEEHTAEIAKGKFAVIDYPSNEPEIGKVFDSFNRMSEELRERQRQLVRSESFAALGTLVAGVAHDVTTPLSTIRLHSEVLLEELEGLTELADRDRAFFDKKLNGVIREADRTLKIVRDILQLAPGKSLTAQSIMLKEPIRRAIEFLGSQIPSTIDLTVDVADEIIVHGDEQRMTTVFINLISNAVAAIDREGSITFQARNEEDGMVDVSVRDTGHGISQENLPKIFDPFFSTKQGEKGKGIGLCITHEIISAHKGRIWAESAIGEGTTIRLKLPATGDSE